MTCSFSSEPSILPSTFHVCSVFHGVICASSLTVAPSGSAHSCSNVSCLADTRGARVLCGWSPTCCGIWGGCFASRSNIACPPRGTATITIAAFPLLYGSRTRFASSMLVPGFSFSSTAAPLETSAGDVFSLLRSSFCSGAVIVGSESPAMTICFPWVNVSALAMFSPAAETVSVGFPTTSRDRNVAVCTYCPSPAAGANP